MLVTVVVLIAVVPVTSSVLRPVTVSAAASTDDLAQTVDYSTLARQVAAIVSGPPVDLLETLAVRLADACLAHAGVTAVEIAVHKPQAPLGLPFDDVVVRVRRTR